MKSLRNKLAFTLFLATTAIFPLLAGTLDQAPFQLVAPDTDWKLDDSKQQQLAKDLFLAASLTNDKKQLKSVVMTGPITPSVLALNQICDGIRDSFSNPAVKKLSDEAVTFLGYKAQALAYEVAQPGVQATYNEARVFVIGDIAWVISVSGPLDQKDAVNQMLTFYRPKKT